MELLKDTSFFGFQATSKNGKSIDFVSTVKEGDAKNCVNTFAINIQTKAADGLKTIKHIGYLKHYVHETFPSRVEIGLEFSVTNLNAVSSTISMISQYTKVPLSRITICLS